MIKKLFTALYADESIHYFNEDSGDAVFNCSETSIFINNNNLIIISNNNNNYNYNNNNNNNSNISLDNNFDEDNPDTIIVLVKVLAWYIKFENAKN